MYTERNVVLNSMVFNNEIGMVISWFFNYFFYKEVLKKYSGFLPERPLKYPICPSKFFRFPYKSRTYNNTVQYIIFCQKFLEFF